MLLAESFPLDRLAPLLAHLDETPDIRFCGRGAEDAAIIRLYAAAAAQKREEQQSFADKASQQIRYALGCSPHNAFNWYALFWVEMKRGISAATYLPFLESSYQLAPNDSWLAYFRSGSALPLFYELAPTTQEKVRREFRLLIRDTPEVAVMIMSEADANSKAVMLRLLNDLTYTQKIAFAKLLDKKNVRVDVPGVDYRDLYKQGF
jgi:hypothetical protein